MKRLGRTLNYINNKNSIESVCVIPVDFEELMVRFHICTAFVPPFPRNKTLVKAFWEFGENDREICNCWKGGVLLGLNVCSGSVVAVQSNAITSSNIWEKSSSSHGLLASEDGIVCSTFLVWNSELKLHFGEIMVEMRQKNVVGISGTLWGSC